MKFHLLTREQRFHLQRERLSKWHKKFAWLPVRLEIDRNQVIWLSFVLRKGRAISSESYGKVKKWEWKYAESTFDVLKMDR